MSASDLPSLPRRNSETAADTASDYGQTEFASLVPQGASAGGSEIVTCADFDAYGTRLITGGADHRLRIYEKIEDRWDLLDVWRGHSAVVIDVIQALPPLPLAVHQSVI